MTTVITAFDHTGKEHWCAAESEFLRDGLAAGTLTLNPADKPAIAPAEEPAPTVQDEADEELEESADATEDAPQAEAGNTKSRRSPSRQRKSD